MVMCDCFLQAEDGIRDLVRSRGLGDVYKRQVHDRYRLCVGRHGALPAGTRFHDGDPELCRRLFGCLLYTSDAADERSSVDLGGRRII